MGLIELYLAWRVYACAREARKHRQNQGIVRRIAWQHDLASLRTALAECGVTT